MSHKVKKKIVISFMGEVWNYLDKYLCNPAQKLKEKEEKKTKHKGIGILREKKLGVIWVSLIIKKIILILSLLVL